MLDPSTPGPFAEGDSVTYLLTVTNAGPLDATNVTATDTYPSELTLVTATPSAGTTYNSGSGVWTIGSLNSGAVATLTMAGTVDAGTAGDVVTNSVTAATGDQTDLTTAGDDLDEVFTVLPFLSIDDVTQAETDSGTTTFTFTVTRPMTRRRRVIATMSPSAAAAARSRTAVRPRRSTSRLTVTRNWSRTRHSSSICRTLSVPRSPTARARARSRMTIRRKCP